MLLMPSQRRGLTSCPLPHRGGCCADTGGDGCPCLSPLPVPLAHAYTFPVAHGRTCCPWRTSTDVAASTSHEPRHPRMGHVISHAKPVSSQQPNSSVCQYMTMRGGGGVREFAASSREFAARVYASLRSKVRGEMYRVRSVLRDISSINRIICEPWVLPLFRISTFESPRFSV